MNTVKTPTIMSTKKKLLYSGVTCFAALVVLEAGARCVTLPTPASAPVYEEHEMLIDMLGLPALNEIMESDRNYFWRLKSDIRDAHITGSIGAGVIDFHLNTHGKLRSPPIANPKTRLRILVLGDSCTFGLGVNDDQTWPAQLQVKLHERGMEVEVINAGVPGFSAFQGKAYLEHEGLALKPDLVTICFGINDAQTWASRSDYETALILGRRSWRSLVRRSRVVSLIQQATLRNPPSLNHPNARPRLNESEFDRTLSDIKNLCDRHGIKLIALVWPPEVQIRQRIPVLDRYQQLVVSFGQRKNVPVVNLVEDFMNSDEPSLFVDSIHANAIGCELVAESVSETVARMLQSRSDRRGSATGRR